MFWGCGVLRHLTWGPSAQTSQDPEIHRSCQKLKAAIIEAWNTIIDEEGRDLIRSMYERSQAVIDAGEWHTKD